MRNVHKTWTERSIATMAALALTLACIVGGYGHAAGHAHHHVAYAAYVAGDHAHGTSVVAGPGHDQGEHGGADAGNVHTECYDFLCHGGQAILAEPIAILHPVRSALVILPPASLSSAPPDRLERPPRTPVLA